MRRSTRDLRQLQRLSQSPDPARRGRKRRREDEVTQQSATRDNEGTRKRQRKAQQTKTINYDEIFQGGRAKYKHRIIEYPEASTKWYILRCDEHNVHFANKPIISASNHLASKLHGFPQGASVAVRELGIRVLNCDAAKASQNNMVFAAALKDGYEVRKGNSSKDSQRSEPAAATRSQSVGISFPEPRRTTRRRVDIVENSEEDATAERSQRRSKPFYGITNPVAGELYLGSWRPRNRPDVPLEWYAVVVLPAGDFGTAGIA